MPVKRFQDGAGLTKRERVHIEFSSPPTAEEIEETKRLFAGEFTFEGAVKGFEGIVT